MERFNGRVAVVTGASWGMGAQIAKDLAKAGMKVVAVARRQDKLQELQKLVKSEGATGAIFPRASDMSKEQSVKELFQWIESNLGGVSVLINGAGASFNTPPFQEFEDGDVTNQVEVNVLGVMSASREMMNSARRHGIKDGHIISINSVDVNYLPDLPLSMSVYCSTKRAILAFNRALRYDLKKTPDFSIKVTSIRPGSVDTPGIGDVLRSSMAIDKRTKKHVAISCPEMSRHVQYILACPPDVEITELTIYPTGEVF